MLSLSPRDVLDEILNLIESVSEGFPSYSFNLSIASFATNSSEIVTVSTTWVNPLSSRLEILSWFSALNTVAK